MNCERMHAMDWLRLAIGLTLVGSGVLLYPTEEKRLQSRLEDIWLYACEWRSGTRSWLASLLVAVNRTMLAGIRRLFGTQLLTLHGSAASVVLACASIIAWMALPRAMHWDDLLPRALALGLILAVVALALVSRLFLYCVVGALAYIFVTEGRPGLIFVAVMIAWLTGSVLVHFIRSALADADQQASASAAYRGAIITLALTAATFAIPVLGADYGARRLSETLASEVFTAKPTDIAHEVALLRRFRQYDKWLLFVKFWGMANFYVAVIAIMQACLIVTLALHAVLWPTIERLLYSAQRAQLFTYRKSLITVGLTLIASAVPVVRSAVMWCIGALR